MVLARLVCWTSIDIVSEYLLLSALIYTHGLGGPNVRAVLRERTVSWDTTVHVNRRITSWRYVYWAIMFFIIK